MPCPLTCHNENFVLASAKKTVLIFLMFFTLGVLVGGNIRAILDQLRHGKSNTGSANSLSSLPNSDGSGGSGVLCNPRSKKLPGKDKPKKSTLRSRSSIFRKMRGGDENSSSSAGAISNSIETDSVSAAERDAAADGERIRRRIFAHYDTGSLLARLLATRDSAASASSATRKNTTTGASAANFTTRCVLPSADGPVDAANLSGEDVDQGDGKSNSLLLNCPYFRNEISPEDCSPSISPASSYGNFFLYNYAITEFRFTRRDDVSLNFESSGDHAHSLFDWLIDWLTHRSAVVATTIRSIDWLIGTSFTDNLIDWLIDWLEISMFSVE